MTGSLSDSLKLLSICVIISLVVSFRLTRSNQKDSLTIESHDTSSPSIPNQKISVENDAAKDNLFFLVKVIFFPIVAYIVFMVFLEVLSLFI